MFAFVSELIEARRLELENYLAAHKASAQSGVGIAATLVRLGMVNEEDLASALASAHGARRLDLSSLLEPEDERGDHGVNPRFLRRHAMAVVGTVGGEALVAAADLEDHDALDALDFALDGDIHTVVATFSEIDGLLSQLDDAPLLEARQDDGDTGDVERLLEGESDAPVIRLVQSLLASAVERRASDVHLEPMARHLMVRYRIDGRLVEVDRRNVALAPSIASRIKVMAGLDIAETRLPQDGRLRLTSRGRDVDVRVSTSPTAFGESIVLRLLGRSDLPLDLTRLGLPALALTKINRALDRPHGIILLTGPTGSGKTTTLYAALSRLRRPEVKILTVEDPVEVLLDGVNQVQVRPEIGLSYADTLRAFLRQDPDVLMIGEIRDRETAEIALRAALTGHLVLSTLHTNSTIGAFTRLTDIGIEPYLAASTVNSVIAQRLIRTLCVKCLASRVPTSEEVEAFDAIGVARPDVLNDAVGCHECQGTGYRGRAPLIEVLEMDAPLRHAVRESEIESMINPTPANETLLGHGLALVAAGRTTMIEVRRAVQAE